VLSAVIGSVALLGAAPAAADSTVASVATLREQARARVGGAARVALSPADAQGLSAMLRLNAPDTPSYVRGLGALPHAQQQMAELVHAMLYRGALSTELKAAMGLRIAQANGSPYVAAHAIRALSASNRGKAMLAAIEGNTLDSLKDDDRVALTYAEHLTRNVHGVTDDEFARTGAVYNDSELVELTITVAFFNYFTRYAEAVRLPVEPWALETAGPAPSPGLPRGVRARVALISDDEMAATAALTAAAKDQAAQRTGLGLGVANSQRAMMRAPALGLSWRAYGTAVRSQAVVDRAIQLQVSFAVSNLNGCRYCTLHQVLGLRRLGIDPAKLVAMKKDDDVLTAREKSAVLFARKLTTTPAGITDADYAGLAREFGDAGALEVVLQTCAFAFMNRFTDGLLLPSEDEAIRVYQETYGTSW
jgi:AhpD family alkylhydroperoxidase